MRRAPAVTLDPEQTINPDAIHVGRERLRQRFLEAIPPAMCPEVEQLLSQTHRGGQGLRAWLNAIASGRTDMPASIPPEVVQTYLRHPEAMPWHDCASCGFLVPVISNTDYDLEGQPEQTFFPECPICGGRTGWYLYWAHPRQ